MLYQLALLTKFENLSAHNMSEYLKVGLITLGLFVQITLEIILYGLTLIMITIPFFHVTNTCRSQQ